MVLASSEVLLLSRFLSISVKGLQRTQRHRVYMLTTNDTQIALGFILGASWECLDFPYTGRGLEYDSSVVYLPIALPFLSPY